MLHFEGIKSTCSKNIASDTEILGCRGDAFKVLVVKSVHYSGMVIEQQTITSNS